MSGAVQIYPPFKNHPRTTFFTANSTSAVSSTTQGFLPPNSNTVGTKFFPASAATYFPI